MKKRLHNHLVFQQIHFPHEKRIKIKSFKSFQQRSEKKVES